MRGKLLRRSSIEKNIFSIQDLADMSDLSKKQLPEYTSQFISFEPLTVGMTKSISLLFMKSFLQFIEKSELTSSQLIYIYINIYIYKYVVRKWNMIEDQNLVEGILLAIRNAIIMGHNFHHKSELSGIMEILFGVCGIEYSLEDWFGFKNSTQALRILVSLTKQVHSSLNAYHILPTLFSFLFSLV